MCLIDWLINWLNWILDHYPCFFPLEDSSCIKSFVFTRWQQNAWEKFEISDRFYSLLLSSLLSECWCSGCHIPSVAGWSAWETEFLRHVSSLQPGAVLELVSRSVRTLPSVHSLDVPAPPSLPPALQSVISQQEPRLENRLKKKPRFKKNTKINFLFLRIFICYIFNYRSYLVSYSHCDFFSKTIWHEEWWCIGCSYGS